MNKVTVFFLLLTCIASITIPLMPYLLHSWMAPIGVDVERYSSMESRSFSDYMFLSHSIVQFVGSLLGLTLTLKVIPVVLSLLTGLATYLFARKLGFNLVWSGYAMLLSTVSFQVVSGLYAYILSEWICYVLLLILASLIVDLNTKSKTVLVCLLSMLLLFLHIRVFMVFLGIYCLYWLITSSRLNKTVIMLFSVIVLILNPLFASAISFNKAMQIIDFNLPLTVKINTWLFNVAHGSNLTPVTILGILGVAVIIYNLVKTGKDHKLILLLCMSLPLVSILTSTDTLAWRLTYLVPYPILAVYAISNLRNYGYLIAVCLISFETVLAMDWWHSTYIHRILYG